jgi:UDP-N-acetylglucosamine acyltransferase
MLETSVHPTAVIAGTARLGTGVSIGPYAVVEDEAEIGEGCEIRAHAVVKRYTRLGPGNVVHEHAVLGGEPQDLAYREAPTRLEIGARNVIREGVTLHRASQPDGETRIGSDCLIMAYAHVAHDCRLGDRVILANNVALAGHVRVGDGAFLSGGVAVHQFTRVGRLAMVGGLTKLVQDALPFVLTDGDPGRARGLNVVGLRRAGIDAAQVRALRLAFRLLLRSSLPQGEALERLALQGEPLVGELIEFVRGSRRGFAHVARRPREADPGA